MFFEKSQQCDTNQKVVLEIFFAKKKNMSKRKI